MTAHGAVSGRASSLALAGLLIAWEMASRLAGIAGLPPASQALAQVPATLADPDTLLGIAVRRVAVGYALAVAVAVPIGLAMGRSQAIAAFFNPLLMAIYPVPKAALMHLIMLWLGIGDSSKILVIFLGVTLPVIYHSQQGSRAVEQKMLWSAAAMGVGPPARLVRVVLPAALPNSRRLPHRPGAGADHHGRERNDRAAVRPGRHSVQCPRHGAIRHRLRHDPDRGRVGLRARCRLRTPARTAGEMGRALARPHCEHRVNDRTATLRDGLLGALPLAAIVGLWQVIVLAGLAPPALLPAPDAVLMRLVQQFGSSAYLDHVATTLGRLFAGFGIAVMVGVGLGLAATGSRWAGGVIAPLVRVLAPVPKIALYPALVLTLGFEDASKIALVVADAVFPVLLATAQGTAAVEPKLAWSAQAAGASRLRCLLTVVLPAALPAILTGCRIALVISCIVVFLAEMITSTDGLGHLLVRAARSFQTVDMFVPLITISLLGLLLNAGFNLLRRRLLAGFPEEK